MINVLQFLSMSRTWAAVGGDPCNHGQTQQTWTKHHIFYYISATQRIESSWSSEYDQRDLSSFPFLCHQQYGQGISKVSQLHWQTRTESTKVLRAFVRPAAAVPVDVMAADGYTMGKLPVWPFRVCYVASCGPYLSLGIERWNDFWFLFRNSHMCVWREYSAMKGCGIHPCTLAPFWTATSTGWQYCQSE